MKNDRVYQLTMGGVIAAIYVILSIICNAFGLANSAVQIRLSEAMTVLPYLSASAIPGLTIGCLLSNVITGCPLPDVVFGTLATFLGAIGTYLLRKKSRFLAPVPPILTNAIIIPIVLYYAYGIRPWWFLTVSVTAGEIISCGVLGLILLNALLKRKFINN